MDDNRGFQVLVHWMAAVFLIYPNPSSRVRAVAETITRCREIDSRDDDDDDDDFDDRRTVAFSPKGSSPPQLRRSATSAT